MLVLYLSRLLLFCVIVQKVECLTKRFRTPKLRLQRPLLSLRVKTSTRSPSAKSRRDGVLATCRPFRLPPGLLASDGPRSGRLLPLPSVRRYRGKPATKAPQAAFSYPAAADNSGFGGVKCRDDQSGLERFHISGERSCSIALPWTSSISL